MSLGPKRPKPKPLFEDVGICYTIQLEDKWQACVDMKDDGPSVTLDEEFDTEGEAVEALKKWAADRGLFTTWVSMTVRKKA